MGATMTRTEATAAVMTGAMALTHAHDVVDGRTRVVLKPLSRGAAIEEFYTLAVMLGVAATLAFERSLRSAARGTDDAGYARVLEAMRLTLWAGEMERREPELVVAALAHGERRPVA